jgi:hypothetical protein
MSVWAQSWAFEQHVGVPGAKFVLISLAAFADEEGVCYPSQQTLADMTEQGQRTVRRHLETLEALGFIARTTRRRYNGKWNSDSFKLLAPAERLRPNRPQAKMAAGQNDRRPEQPEANLTAGQKEPSQRPKTTQPAAKNDTGQRPDWPAIKSIEPSEETSGEPSVAPRHRAVAISTPFDVDEEMAHWAIDKGMSREFVERETEKFVNYFISTGRTMRDWTAAWRNWLLRAQEQVGSRRRA